MLRQLLFVPILLFVFSLDAQVPSKMLYQAVYRNNDGTIKKNAQVDVEFQIRAGNDVRYSEVHDATTNNFGLLNLIIGEGQVQSGNLSTIDWGEGDLTLQVFFDGEEVQNEAFLSTPYSQISRTVEDNAINSLKIMNGGVTTSDLANGAVNSQKIADGSVGALDLSDMGASTGQVLTWDGSAWIPMTNGGGNNWGSQDIAIASGGGLVGNGDETPLAIAPMGIQLEHLGRMGANSGEVLKWNGSQWMPGMDNGGSDGPWERIGDTAVVLKNTMDNVGINVIPAVGELEVDDRIIIREDGRLTLDFQQSSSGGGFIETHGPLGSENIRLTNLASNPDHGYISVRNDQSELRGRFYVSSSGTGILGLDGPNGNTNCLITSLGENYRNNGRMALYNEDGNSRLNFYVSEEEGGIIAADGPNGNLNVLMTFLVGSPNHGHMAVYDASGEQQAGMYIDNFGRGVIFKDINSFRMEHPEDMEKEIVYACIEGPEAGAYSRGTSELSDGEAWVTFPEHFQTVINAGHLTITVTSQSAETYGLAVVERSETGFRVKELAKGQGNFKFDWIAMAVRKGYEDFEVIQDKLQPYRVEAFDQDTNEVEESQDEMQR